MLFLLNNNYNAMGRSVEFESRSQVLLITFVLPSATDNQNELCLLRWCSEVPGGKSTQSVDFLWFCVGWKPQYCARVGQSSMLFFQTINPCSSGALHFKGKCWRWYKKKTQNKSSFIGCRQSYDLTADKKISVCVTALLCNLFEQQSWESGSFVRVPRWRSERKLSA